MSFEIQIVHVICDETYVTHIKLKLLIINKNKIQ